MLIAYIVSMLLSWVFIAWGRDVKRIDRKQGYFYLILSVIPLVNTLLAIYFTVIYYVRLYVKLRIEQERGYHSRRF